MKKKAIITILVIVLFYSCTDKKQKNFEIYDAKEFIDEFFEVNSETIFNDEIERVKVNYFKDSNFLVYTFKNRKKLNKEGVLFLQVFAKDTANLPDKRKTHGSINLSIKKDEVFRFTPTRNFLIKKLQFPFEVKAIATGNIIDNRKNWSIYYNKLNSLDNQRSDSRMISNSEDLIFDKFKSSKSRLVLGNIGVKIYSNSKKKIEIYFNCNNQTLIAYFGDLQKVVNNGDLVVKVFDKNSQSSIIRKLDLNKIKKEKNLGLSLMQFEDSLHIQSLSITQNDWSKKTEINKLIHYTHVKQLLPNNYNKASEEVKISTLINYFLSNILKSLYTENNNFDIYTNSSRQSFFIKRLVQQNNTKKVFIRLHSGNKIHTGNKPYKDFSLENKKRLIVKDNKGKIFEIFHLRLSHNITKVEFANSENFDSQSFYVFEK